MSDLKLIETGSGGDLVLLGNDLVVINSFQNMPYLALFGGNIEENTKTYEYGEQRFDYWANELLYNKLPKIQYNSNTERLLNKSVLNSSSRLLIEETIKKDLSFMSEFSTISVESSITSVDRLEILVKIDQPNNLESVIFTYIWNVAKQELITINN